ncbi:hypothetical protein [Flavobacterium sp.]|uniref:hypothetical protein n=1 Tax=Flavobacterium sp. TaxID=239 RepID=UPI0039E3821B
MKTLKIAILLCIAANFAISCSSDEFSENTPQSPQNYNTHKAGGGGNPPQPVANNVVTIAGNQPGYADGTGTAALFMFPRGLCKDASGNVYVADYANHKIRKITPANVVTTFAGSSNGYANGTGTAAQFSYPFGLCMDSSGNLFVSEAYGRIRKITPAGVVSTFVYLVAALPPGIAYSPDDICIDSLDNIYVADVNNELIHKITPAGVVSTFAGSTLGYADGTGTAAQFNNPAGICTDSSDNIYVSDAGNVKVRAISPAGVVTTLAGSTAGYNDGAPASAQFNNLAGMCVNGNVIYVTDDHRIRKIAITNGTVYTMAGGAFAGDVDAVGANARFNAPQGVVFANSKLYVADTFNSKIKTVTP